MAPAEPGLDDRDRDAATRELVERGPNVLGMIALVAVVVALTILIFFALGYAFGRMFL